MDRPVKILVADDERNQREILVSSLCREGFRAEGATGLPQALALLEQAREASDPFGVVVTDLRMPSDKEGLELLQQARHDDPLCEVILVTAYATDDVAFSSGKARAFGFLSKPLDLEKTLITITSAAEKSKLARDHADLKELLVSGKDAFCGIVGKSAEMTDLYRMIERVAGADATCLINGESGTGKELVARAVHQMSARKKNPFLAINCAAIPENLIESELFGHEKGVFTGATSRRVGRFEDVGAGTLFLDEIGSMELSLQPKLLRAVQEMEFSRVGSAETISFRGRIVAATARDLEAAVAEGEFREDLFFRLNVIVLTIPPLRQRKDDLPLLIDHFLARGSRRHGKNFQGVSAAVMTAFEGHSWPGNVRELENSLERMMVLGEGEVLGVDLLPPTIANLQSQLLPVGDGPFQLPREGLILEDLERSLIEQALQRTGGSLDPAAKMLGISYKTLQYRIKKYRLKKENGMLSEEIIPGEGRIA
ncbi:MAG: sigma-54-dependent Fis family transcriptional regulator [Planctomycetes bacterium]|jgi:DNA-binding NtrC family response regulator|nr:sigma-54-dependent Fis family transcriptional regulator [Planctomycetota bacterium]MBT6452024.1 sigma-54-dependent Fis family transcriptional regulator [Planctomycetota bacterium]MBT6540043.1 sigma-54-dependent Fis family transcriptional regulator [Planctomycetota bacterium]MBT6784242.1 sigma-54-dependent Fis family transcriptional regulator [Planctomycetota bacterium]MBT7639590.1 sigma-54-dependent Fis family transcriptional regulator [Planctomycetota bacterium]